MGVNFLYFFSELVCITSSFNALSDLFEGCNFFGDCFVLLLTYTWVGSGISSGPLFTVMFGAVYYAILHFYAMTSLIPYAFIAQLYQLLFTLFAYTSYFSLVCLDSLTSKFVCLPIEIIVFFFGFAFDLANLFIFAFLNNILTVSESYVTSFFAAISECFGNLALTLPAVFYAYYAAAALFFSCGLLIINRFFIVRTARSRIIANSLLESQQTVRIGTYFGRGAPLLDYIVYDTNLPSISLKPYSVAGRAPVAQLIYQIKFLCNWVFTSATQFDFLEMRDSRISAQLGKISGMIFLMLISCMRKQKEIFLCGFVGCYFAVVNFLRRFVTGGLAYSKPRNLLVENISGGPKTILKLGSDLQHLYLIATLPLFFVTYMSDLFF